MQRRGSGRFGKYGDLKRKEKIRQTRLLKHDGIMKQKLQWPVVAEPKKPRPFKLGVDGEFWSTEKRGSAEICKSEDDGR